MILSSARPLFIGACDQEDHAHDCPPLTWLNILCLDAPIIAVSWQWLFAKSFHLLADPAGVAALFFTTWQIYLVDRFVDSTSLRPDVPKSARQIFCTQHRKSWLWLLIMPVAAMDIATCWQLGHTTLLRGIFLGVIVVGYLAINHARSELWQTIPLKEMIVGFLFAAGTLLALGSRLHPARSTIAVAALLFASLCTLNCVSIAVWERDLDRAQGRHSIATRRVRVKSYGRASSFILAAVSGFLFISDPHLWPISVCIGASAILLAALHFAAIARDERTALADLVFLTPLALMLIWKIL